MQPRLMRIVFALLSLFALPSLSSCNREMRGVITSDERRIWVIQRVAGRDVIFRCGDTAGNDGPPRPVCIRAHSVEEGQ